LNATFNVIMLCLMSIRHFSTGAEVSFGQFGTGADLSGQIGTIALVPKCLGAELSWCRSVRTP